MLFGTHLNDGGSALVITNHFSSDDIPLELSYLVATLGTSISQLTVPVSKKQHDGREGLTNAMVLKALPALGVQRPLLVQSYDRDYYGTELADQLRDNAFAKINITLQTPGGMVMYPPEGTRSRDGRLRQARSGVGHIILNHLLSMTDGSPTPVIVPVAIVPEGEFSRSFNWKFSSGPNDGLQIRVGQAVPMDEISYIFRPRKITYDCMELLKGIIPAHMHGYYTSS